MSVSSNGLSGDKLLSCLSSFIRRFIVLTEAQSDICALWIAHTHAFNSASFTPYLNIASPLPRSGKTTLLEILSLLIAKPWLTGRVTTGVLVRKTDKDHPSLLLDESDAAFQANREYAEALRGVLNTGFEREGVYSMCVHLKNEWVPKDFSTFSPKAIAGIGRLPDTVQDRSLLIRLKRKLPSEPCEGFRKGRVRAEAEKLKADAARWVNENIETLQRSDPPMPLELNDRQKDVCEPLLAIADLAGEEWPGRSRRALLEVCGGQVAREESAALTLLGDLKSCFDGCGAERMPTSQLLDELRIIEESPWADYQRGYPLNANGLARLLKPFDVRPRDLRFEHRIQKGYQRMDFEEAWTRYLPIPVLASEGQQAQQITDYAGKTTFREGQQTAFVADDKTEKLPANMRVVADVAAPMSPPWDDLGPATKRRTSASTNGLGHCFVHPFNNTEWCNRGKDLVCDICHPGPLCVSPTSE